MKEILTIRTVQREDDGALRRRAEKQLHTKLSKSTRLQILKLSLDARDKGAVRWQYRVLVTDEVEEKRRAVRQLPPPSFPPVNRWIRGKPKTVSAFRINFKALL